MRNAYKTRPVTQLCSYLLSLEDYAARFVLHNARRGRDIETDGRGEIGSAVGETAGPNRAQYF